MAYHILYIVLRLTKIIYYSHGSQSTVKDGEMSSLASPPVRNLRSVGQCDRGAR